MKPAFSTPFLQGNSLVKNAPKYNHSATVINQGKDSIDNRSAIGVNLTSLDNRSARKGSNKSPKSTIAAGVMAKGLNQSKDNSIQMQPEQPQVKKSVKIVSKYEKQKKAANDESKNRKLKEFKKILKRKDDNLQFDDGDEEAEAIDQQVISENRKNLKKSFLVIFPDSNLRTCWDLMSFVFTIYQSILIPYRISFEQEATGGFYYYELFIDCFFMAEIFVTFNTGYYSHGNLIMERRYIIFHYMRTWFFMDLFASFPYSWIIDLTSSGDEADSTGEAAQSASTTSQSSDGGSAVYKTPQLLRLLRIVRFLRILRLLRVLKLRKLLMRLEDYIVSDRMNALVEFLKLMLIIIFIAHWIACFFWYVGYSETTNRGESWILKAGIQDSPVADKYLTSLYWAFTTMTTVGYGDVHPLTPNERLYGFFAMLVACGVFAYTVGNIGEMVTRLNLQATQYKEKMTYVNQFLIHKEIPKDIRMKVRNYLEYVWTSKKEIKIEEQEVMEILNENLRDKLILYLNGRILKDIKVFEDFDLEFLSEITFIFCQVTYMIDDNIIVEEDPGGKVFFIVKGKVAILHRKSRTYIKDLGKDDFFGEIGFFSEKPRQATAKSRDFTHLLVLDHDKFAEKTEEFRKTMHRFYLIKNSINQNNDYKHLKIQCYV